MEGSIRKRGSKSWELTLDLGRDEKGKRDRRYFTVHGTKKQAQQRLRELLTEVDGGIVPSPERIKMREWLARWMSDCVVGYLSQATQDRYAGIIKNHLNPAVGHIELRKLSPGHVQAMQQKLLQGGMDPTGVNLVRTVLSGAMRHALGLELIVRNPVAATKAPPDPDREVQPPPVEAVIKMLGLAEEQDDWLYPAMHLLVYTGIRRGELLALKWGAINFEKCELRIVSSLGRRSNGLNLTKPKTARGNRVITLATSTVDVMRYYKKLQEQHKVMMAGAYEDNGIMFADDFGRWLNPMRLTRRVKSLGKQIGHPDAGPHNLRHFNGSVSIDAGVNLVVVSERLGHSNPTITLAIYAHALPGKQKQAADDFERVMDESQQMMNSDANSSENTDTEAV